MFYILAIALLQQKAEPPVQKPLVLSYSIVSNGTVVGSETDTIDKKAIAVEYEFNDRGRGPQVSGTYEFMSNGLPSRVVVTGHDYYKAPVDEHFWLANDKAHWKSTTEEGSAAKGGFFVSMNGSASEAGLLASSLLRAKKSLALYPGGQASIEKVQDATLSANADKKHVTQYAISGLGFAPLMIWLDDDNHFFASVNSWQSTIRKGWEGSIAKMLKQQDSSVDAWYSKIAQSTSTHPKFPVCFRHVRVFDSENARMLEDQDVLVDGNKIVQVGPDASFDVPPNSEQIYGGGQTLLPGLFDMHVHLGVGDGLLNIANGVTSVRDMGNSIELLQDLSKKWDTGDQIGPRINKAGLVDGSGPYQCPVGLYCSSLEEALADVNRYADLGYIQLKIYSSVDPSFVIPMAKLAHQRGMRVSGHVPQGLFASDFVNDGADEIQHMNFVMLNVLRDHKIDSRTPERFTMPAQYGSSIDLNSKAVNDFVQLLLDHHTTIDATMSVFEESWCARQGQCEPGFESIYGRLPTQFQRFSLAGGLPVTPQTDQTYKNSFDTMLHFVNKLYKAGVPILAGTDATAGFMLHRELELEVRAGIPPVKALQIATWNAASLLKVQDKLGSIAPGKTADLYLVEGDPSVNIGNVRRSRMVMKDGVLFQSDQLFRAQGIKPAK